MTSTVHPWPELLADLRRYVRARVNDEHAAEDIVQDTLAKLAARDGKAPAGPVHAWVLRVARNAVIDHWRRSTGPTGSEHLLADETAHTPTKASERHGLLTSFRAFLHALPPEQREALLVTEYEGVSQSDLAKRLGVPLSTVKSRVQRARKRLATALQDCCTFEFDRRGGIVDWRRRPGGACHDC
jgi:RNA polymerase sigma-70 factor (ECF subfamily)